MGKHCPGCCGPCVSLKSSPLNLAAWFMLTAKVCRSADCLRGSSGKVLVLLGHWFMAEPGLNSLDYVDAQLKGLNELVRSNTSHKDSTGYSHDKLLALIPP